MPRMETPELVGLVLKLRRGTAHTRRLTRGRRAHTALCNQGDLGSHCRHATHACVISESLFPHCKQGEHAAPGLTMKMR